MSEKEIKILKGFASQNCISCDMMHKNGNCLSVGGFCTSVPAAYCPLIPELREKLERYEKAEREGRLVELPCKIGEMVYRVVPKCNPNFGVCPYDGGFGIERCRDRLCGAHVEEKRLWYSDVPLIGKTVFLTREEAEEALKERG